MITLKFHKDFLKQVSNLKPAQKKRLQAALKLFQKDPNYPGLYNHSLMGEWKGYRSIAFGGDWRAHFELTDNDTIAWFVACGTHSQLYK
ncbi:MAG TPA: type II toxin-antitoxin system mRNA interferase toxin, RelE/StbE family [Candidatus Saccharimonadales bacterium]|nr:type II toxin-antitoxin system mRNA interferase toxin, RelE/StbE family [Candidatus Saccharimonadales bacterium]